MADTVVEIPSEKKLFKQIVDNAYDADRPVRYQLCNNVELDVANGRIMHTSVTDNSESTVLTVNQGKDFVIKFEQPTEDGSFAGGGFYNNIFLFNRLVEYEAERNTQRVMVQKAIGEALDTAHNFKTVVDKFHTDMLQCSSHWHDLDTFKIVEMMYREFLCNIVGVMNNTCGEPDPDPSAMIMAMKTVFDLTHNSEDKA